MEIKNSTITIRGKTTALAKLPNTLIVDLENGSDYVEGFIVKANNVQELNQIARSMIPSINGRPNPHYEENDVKIIVIDTITALEDMCLPLAKKLYDNNSRQNHSIR